MLDMPGYINISEVIFFLLYAIVVDLFMYQFIIVIGFAGNGGPQSSITDLIISLMCLFLMILSSELP